MADMQKIKEQILRISGVDPCKCMKCGKCSASCPSYEEMEFHPHQFVAMIDDGEIVPLLQSDSINKCLSCMACAERCPRGVEPGKLVEAVRLVAVRQRGGDRLTADSVSSMAQGGMPQQALVTAFRKFKK